MQKLPAAPLEQFFAAIHEGVTKPEKNPLLSFGRSPLWLVQKTPFRTLQEWGGVAEFLAAPERLPCWPAEPPCFPLMGALWGALWPSVKSLATTGLCGFGATAAATHRATLSGTARAFHPTFVPPFIRLSPIRQNPLTAWVLGADRQGAGKVRRKPAPWPPSRPCPACGGGAGS